jgi:glutamate-1-semialdehyde 2,1-aminomutase
MFLNLSKLHELTEAQVLTDKPSGRHQSFNDDVAHALEEAETRYSAANPVSAALFQTACQYLPGGSTRATTFYPPFPVTLVRGDGASLWDADGHEYTDFLGDYTAGVFGHNLAMVNEIFATVRGTGLSLGGPSAYESHLAELLCKRIPSCEQVRFCNSGTEANIFALALARCFTGRKGTLVFDGGYHGGALIFGHNDGPLNIELSHINGTFNDLEGTREKICNHGDSLAAILVEPMMGSAGCIPADRDFLLMLREESERLGIVLIFDEVMSSRLGPGGLQGHYGVYPDMTTLGKFLGGGFSFGAFGGRADIMSLLDIRSPTGLRHAGTFNNNICSMVGGAIGLSKYYTPSASREVNQRGDGLREDLNAIASRHSLPVFTSGIGGVMNFHFTAGPLRHPSQIPELKTAPLRRLLHFHLLEAGYYTAPRGLITISMGVDDADVQGLKQSIEAFLKTHSDLIRRSL